MIPRKTGSESSEIIASIASRGLRNPASLTLEEIQKVCASALEQREPPTIPITPRLKRNPLSKVLSESALPPRRAKPESKGELPEWFKRLHRR